MIRTVTVSLVAGISLAACNGSVSVISTAHVDERTLVCTDDTDNSPDDGLPVGNSAPASQHGEVSELAPLQPGPDGSPPSQLVIYFHCDRIKIPSQFDEMLRAHGAYLVENRDLGVLLAGHADDTRIPEYNLGLAESRVQSVRRALMLYGVSDDQVATVSGNMAESEAFASDDTGYSLNRRVLLVYQQPLGKSRVAPRPTSRPARQVGERDGQVPVGAARPGSFTARNFLR